MARRCLLLAGSVGPERLPARPDREDADWYLPLHVRDAARARDRIAAQVAAGADVVVAPTWLTHRRALLPLGETRRAAAWTAAAVDLAREAVEAGLERREDALADAPEDDAGPARPAPLVAAVLPALDEEAEAATGRLLPAEAATQRDYRDQAGYLADAEPDLLLTEGQRTGAALRAALAEAAETGLPVWAVVHPAALVEQELAAWLEWGAVIGVATVLVPPPLDTRLAALEQAAAWGGFGVDPAQAGDWLDAGATVLARLDGAGAERLASLRDAIDDHERASAAAAREASRRWQQHVAAAAAMASGGAAVWLGRAPAALPAGFRWLQVSPDDISRLPSDHFRLVVAAADVTADVSRVLEPGGLLVTRGSPVRLPTGLRVLRVDGDAEPPLLTCRREDR